MGAAGPPIWPPPPPDPATSLRLSTNAEWAGRNERHGSQVLLLGLAEDEEEAVESGPVLGPQNVRQLGVDIVVGLPFSNHFLANSGRWLSSPGMGGGGANDKGNLYLEAIQLVLEDDLFREKRLVEVGPHGELPDEGGAVAANHLSMRLHFPPATSLPNSCGGGLSELPCVCELHFPSSDTPDPALFDKPA